ncbi:hypothetical protein H6F88_11855 [Oculatella sp. FACHB-28]|uniref:hypothetical protein n=1 Tax=Cyanophyceae TaxID=3028117 RepID=UPI0016856F02|nr:MULTISPECIES: hypothetical protein [Cyanophyceae]MBD1868924.1 hypothetical protein [Cyanobacteria bacterium FACHB-471]MBD1997058.1 hypothetical protein [Leptolyngbya sp. FACHB-541]MBD2056698.1 hypothetical protein [Oculatella sp. FACHB-28]
MFEGRRLRRTLLMALLAIAAMLGVFFAGFLSGGQPANAETRLAEEIAKEVIAACPLADPSDSAARDECGQKLGDSKILSDATAVPVLWGTQLQRNNYNIRTLRTTTRFHPLVMWRVYLSVFMFKGDYRIEQVGDANAGTQQTIIYFPYEYRNDLGLGEYPYPYWHSRTKWESFQFSPEVLMVIEQGKIKAVLRSAEKDRSRDYNSRTWDGRWTWIGETGQQEPRVTLFSYLLSEDNPYTEELDQTYRALDAESRKHDCQTCHNPGNPSFIAPLGIMNYPNQALSIRHTIVRVMESNRMPPAAVDSDGEFIHAGIIDEAERRKYLELARAFAEAGDKALKFEGQPIQ